MRKPSYNNVADTDDMEQQEEEEHNTLFERST